MQITPPSLPPLLTTVDNPSALFEDEDSIEGVDVRDSFVMTDQLQKTSISESLLSKIDFSQVNAHRFDISDCALKNCNFTASKFPDSSWHRVSIEGTRCSGLQVTNGTMKHVTFTNSKLEIVNFRFSRFENVRFEDCVLDDVDFYEARLKNIEFVNCTINKMTFANASIVNVDISKSTVDTVIGIRSLRGVTISYDQLMQFAPGFASEAGIKIK